MHLIVSIFFKLAFEIHFTNSIDSKSADTTLMLPIKDH